MPDPRWFEVPADMVPVHRDNDRLSALLRVNSSRGTKAGHFKVHTAGGYGFAVFDVTNADRSLPLHSTKYTPRAKTVPWNPKWKPPAGTDGNVIIYDPRTGQRWGVWMARRKTATKLFGVTVAPERLECGAAWQICQRAVDSKGRDVDGPPADMRVYRGNYPWCNGAGVIPRIPTVAQLDTHIPFALSWTMNSATVPESMVVAPAGQVETPAGVSFGGVRFSWRNVDTALDTCLGDIPAEYRHRVEALARCMAEFGGTVDATGPAAGILLGDLDLPPDCIDSIARTVEWVVHEPPHGLRDGIDVGTEARWCDDFRYVS